MSQGHSSECFPRFYYLFYGISIYCSVILLIAVNMDFICEFIVAERNTWTILIILLQQFLPCRYPSIPHNLDMCNKTHLFFSICFLAAMLVAILLKYNAENEIQCQKANS